MANTHTGFEDDDIVNEVDVDSYVKPNKKVDDNDKDNDDDSLASLVSDDLDATTGATETSTEDPSDNKHEIGGDESAAVFKQRLVVFLILFLAALGVSLTVYFLTAAAEHAEFEAQFDSTAQKVIDSFQDIVVQKFSALASLSVSFTAYVRSQQQSGDMEVAWPFVTINDFHQRSATARSLSDALMIQLLPVIDQDKRIAWEEYSNNNTYWMQEGLVYQQALGLGLDKDGSKRLLEEDKEEEEEEAPKLELTNDETDEITFATGVANVIYDYSLEGVMSPSPPRPQYFPLSQFSPIIRSSPGNFDYGFRMRAAYEHSKLFIGPIYTYGPATPDSADPRAAFYATLLTFAAGEPTMYMGDPTSQIFVPVFEHYEQDRGTEKPVAFIAAYIIWGTYFKDMLSPSVEGVIVVLENPCEGAFTYMLNGPNATFLGNGDLHDPKYHKYGRTAMLGDLGETAQRALLGLGLYQEECPIGIRVYPSATFEDNYQSNLPILVTMAVGLVFVFTAAMFLLYDRLVERRQDVVLSSATQSSAIVSNLFPESIAEKLMQAEADKQAAKSGQKHAFRSATVRLQSFLDGDDEGTQLADLFLDCTVIYCDIAGFTAWSSTRDPSQVFTLLQTIFQAFDQIATRNRVFKVETIGDSYVAVTGIPKPQNNHAILMARFAQECLNKFNVLVKKLEVSLGPDTADLAMRFGIHSGPVTAGVLRGERSRFQLFGDTVNTTACIESTCRRNAIQVSEATAKLLMAANKGHWLTKREDVVNAKGKIGLVTYWLAVRRRGGGGSSVVSDSEANVYAIEDELKETTKQSRLIDWATDLLVGHLKAIVARNQAIGQQTSKKTPTLAKQTRVPGETSLDEVVEVIEMPTFEASHAGEADISQVKIPEKVIAQLNRCVASIAATYRTNPFHNFEHACHVTMAVDKFMKRIVAPDLRTTGVEQSQSVSAMLHEYTHGITSDPLLLFAIVFSALIHDADHRGVSNTQLMKEDPALGVTYKGKSIAEQNSLDIAWDILMRDEFVDLQACIFGGSESEMKRFRQVIVNVVLATDIFDKELNDLRKGRWARAFSNEKQQDEQHNDLRATIVIEHIIQASDVSHTMQHWHVYRKWNQHLFHEMRLAYQEGRMGADPASFWFKGELGFFDNYIIPLAKKLKECNVFGVSSDECLVYAMQNRSEWEQRGEGIVEEMLQETYEQCLGDGFEDEGLDTILE
ncbi:Receptor-type guanylate cyclase gcy [Seminavis robusta]|uniref:Receptor-type guanylate cyclase gcy n=1 Tax=Seminavis robusta TaxID=568900 RepID=A0A9N8F3P9_9STRA|nr:Receptor-type guanylate cyclase gcy [Seminavis robusta]|eukprot:Sro2765_g336630.1 Receptor-type guanylate cyclase gcy (1206) ;mRNA; f:1225-5347